MEPDKTSLESISPYTDAEAVEALGHLAEHPVIPGISKYIFPNEPETFLADTLKSIRSIDEFQSIVMSQAIEWVLSATCRNFSYDGFNRLPDGGRKFLAISNHRDIILDPAITQYVLYKNGLPMTEIAVGDNLIKNNKIVEWMLRSNRMIKVIRGVSARELYLSSQVLSKYIRQTITSGKSSIWLAQRQGRTKDGMDMTEQGLLKMLDMSGEGTFLENFRALNIVPMSISYEIEPCDIMKARELLISRTEKYVKGSREDLISILTGIRQQKGNVHLHIGSPLTDEEIEQASHCDKNDRYQSIRHAVDLRVIDGYKLWKNNYIAYDLFNHNFKYSDMYTTEDVERFVSYMESQLDTVEKMLNRADLREIFLRIYGNPVVSKEMLAAEKGLQDFRWNS